MLFSSSLFPSGRLPSTRSGAYVARVWSNGAAVRAYPAPTAPALQYVHTSTRRPRKAGTRRGLLSVACQLHGTTLRGFLPRAWDHLVASDGTTTRRVAPLVLITYVTRCLQVDRQKLRGRR